VDGFLEAILAAQRAQNCIGGCPMGNLAAELADVHEGFRRRLAGVFDLWRSRLAQALARDQADGTLATDAPADHLARFIVAGLEGAMLLTKVQKDIRVMETCVAELRRHLGLSPRTAEPVGSRR
jgi:TetR/AcrR family transcriptional repressor of nem operon